MSAPLAPIRLPANQPTQFYRGGAAIAALRSASSGDTTDLAREFGPEDWVASTTTLFGRDTEGLTRLPDGRWLRDAVEADPVGWLGRDHVEAFGSSTALLVKLLDAGQRLPVHFHPDDEFARRHFDSHFGKTEAWIVVGTQGPSPTVYAGFREALDPRTVADWVADQDAPSMLNALNAVPVEPGDTVHVPAGLPHAIGEGVFVVELQQPTDFSLTLEWRDFLGDEAKGHLGLGFDTALKALDTSAWDEQRLAGLIRRTATVDTAVVDLLVPGSRPFFRADRLRPTTPLALDPSFTVLVVSGGHGRLKTARGDSYDVSTGDTWVVPHAAGELELDGDVTVIRCRPPAVRG
ncbi:class I mannose-6-phosphate isomerase [Saccharomonospora glauca]|uniref:Phosphomannose isomerase n=1 Tax=Saccharomonospora glauca K62 TaxID=928724 RepID=I1D578_9PSEU|nr:class I mannose-6-phosphate isomerase [Saccharomonospora glauca]EIF00103.1 phosphomannose isomerase [Saccharomonospora glauca K62]